MITSDAGCCGELALGVASTLGQRFLIADGVFLVVCLLFASDVAFSLAAQTVNHLLGLVLDDHAIELRPNNLFLILRHMRDRFELEP